MRTKAIETLAKAKHECHHALEKAKDYPPAAHVHHYAYAAYYGYSLFEDHGVKFMLVTILFAFCCIHALLNVDE